MRFEKTALAGVWTVDLTSSEDDRGFFARSFCRDEFAARGLQSRVAQCNISFDRRRGTLRGMHFQKAPKEEAKLVCCTRGAIFDVVLDVRPGSATRGRWLSFELTQDNRRAVYIAPGLAHGFQSLTDGSEVFYQMSEIYDAALAAGVRWDDPAFGIAWPIRPPILSGRDRAYPDFQ